MNTLYLEKSTGNCRDGKWVENLELSRIERIVVGIGPGSFAGIRSALAFAQGYAIGSGCEVLGLPSACALVEDEAPLAVVGDARQGKIWIALFRNFQLEREIFQVETENLASAISAEYRIVTPDDARIGALLTKLFGERYCGGRQPTEAGLQRFAEKNPAILRPEPLPVYLNPAVR